MKQIKGGFTSLGDAHFQDVAKAALERWGYFPPHHPPDWMAREREIRFGFADTLGKVMNLTDYSEQIQSYRDRAVAAENRVQELLRVIAGYEQDRKTEPVS